jgi:hypothetical protein
MCFGSDFHVFFPDSFLALPRASGPVFMFSAHILVFGGTEGVGSHFHVFPARARFRLYRWRRVPFSSFALPDSFSAVPRASGPVFMFCAPGLVFGGTEGVGSRFNVLRAWTHFWRYVVRRVPISCFARPFSFSAVPRASGPILMYCGSGLVFLVPRASCPVFMFCAPGLVFSCTEDIRSRFHILRARTRFRRYRGRRVPFS